MRSNHDRFHHVGTLNGILSCDCTFILSFTLAPDAQVAHLYSQNTTSAFHAGHAPAVLRRGAFAISEITRAHAVGNARQLLCAAC